VRKSARHTDGASSMSMLEKAQQLTAGKNLENSNDVEKGTGFFCP
jgi:hypothetical protein